MFIAKNIGDNEKAPTYSESKTQPTIKVRVIYLFDVKAGDTQRYQCRSYIV